MLLYTLPKLSINCNNERDAEWTRWIMESFSYERRGIYSWALSFSLSCFVGWNVSMRFLLTLSWITMKWMRSAKKVQNENFYRSQSNGVSGEIRRLNITCGLHCYLSGWYSILFYISSILKFPMHDFFVHYCANSMLSEPHSEKYGIRTEKHIEVSCWHLDKKKLLYCKQQYFPLNGRIFCFIWTIYNIWIFLEGVAKVHGCFYTACVCFFFFNKNKLGEKEIQLPLVFGLQKIYWISKITLNFFKVKLNKI